MEGQASATQGVEGFLSIVMILAMMAAVVGLAYLATRFVGKRVMPQGGGRHIKVLDRVQLGQDMALLLVRVAGKTMLIGTAQHEMRKLCDIEGDEIPDPPDPEPMPFQQMLKDALRKGRGGEGGGQNGG